MYIPNVIPADANLASNVAAYVLASQGKHLPNVLAAGWQAYARIMQETLESDARQAIKDLEIICNARKTLRKYENDDVFSVL